eukprot:11227972-Lingulodinium_polyedra.AAC.1
MPPAARAPCTSCAIQAKALCWRLRFTRSRNSTPLPSSPSTSVRGALMECRGVAVASMPRAMQRPP